MQAVRYSDDSAADELAECGWKPEKRRIHRKKDAAGILGEEIAALSAEEVAYRCYGMLSIHCSMGWKVVGAVHALAFATDVAVRNLSGEDATRQIDDEMKGATRRVLDDPFSMAGWYLCGLDSARAVWLGSTEGDSPGLALRRTYHVVACIVREYVASARSCDRMVDYVRVLLGNDGGRGSGIPEAMAEKVAEKMAKHATVFPSTPGVCSFYCRTRLVADRAVAKLGV